MKNKKTKGEDVFDAVEGVEIIPLAQLYFEETQTNLKLEQNNFMLVQNMFKGGNNE